MSTIRWTENDLCQNAGRHTETGMVPPSKIIIVDDRIGADAALRLIREDAALLWRGDFHNARQLLRSIGRRIQRSAPDPGDSAAEIFHWQRQDRDHRARVLGRLTILLERDCSLSLRRAPDVRQACLEAYGQSRKPMIISLTELPGVIGAHQWRSKGLLVPGLKTRIHPHYGVFSLTRSDYVDLIARTPLPVGSADHLVAFDIGTGTGVLALLPARRGVAKIIGTDITRRALTCARDNVERIGAEERIEIIGPTLFPEGKANLVVCNPPWLPGRPVRSGTRRLRSRRKHARAVLRVVDRTETSLRHPKIKDDTDALRTIRSEEIISLGRPVIRIQQDHRSG